MINRLLSILAVSLLLTQSGVTIVSAGNIQDTTSANRIAIDFETLADLTRVIDQYANIGVSFSGTTILSQGGSLNFLNFPPRSGVKVVYDDPSNSGTITATFNPSLTSNVSKVGGYVTGNRNVTMTAYDASGNILGTVSTGGANIVGVGTPNLLLEISSNVSIARVTFFNGGERGNTYTIDDFFFESQQSCQITGVPLLKQSNATWANDLYGGTSANPWSYDDDGDKRTDEDPKNNVDDDHDGKIDEDTPETISKWGCALTSAAMLVSYHGIRQNGFTTTPALLNNWLKANGGYSQGSIIWSKAAEYARKNSIQLYYYSGWGPDNGVVNGYICNSLPIILGTSSNPYNGHYVVATGQANSTNWNINDPGGYNLSQLGTGSYTDYRKYGTAAKEPTGLYVVVHSPVELLVTDPAGRKTGFDAATGQYFNEILDSTYRMETIEARDGTNTIVQVKVFDTGAPLSGTYSIQLAGTGTGDYEIDLIAYDMTGNASYASVAGSTTASQRSTLYLEYSGQPGSQISISHRVFLPLMQRNYNSSNLGPGIHGYVTYRGTPIAGISLALRHYNGSTFSTLRTTTTLADGSYHFTYLPSLGSGQSYYVRYVNGGDGNNYNLNYLGFWGSFGVTSYTNGSSVGGGNFDIEDIPLTSPSSGVTVSLPYTFQWVRRTAISSDSYEFDLQDPVDGDPYWWTYPPLGYVNSYTLNMLPTGFSLNTQYMWYLWVYGTDGGYGISRTSRFVTFSNITNGVQNNSSDTTWLHIMKQIQGAEERMLRDIKLTVNPHN